MKQEIDRKSFLTALVAIAAAGWTVACGDEEDGTAATPTDGASGAAGSGGDAGSNDGSVLEDAAPDAEDAVASTCVEGTTASISANHGHTLSVPEADVLAGIEKTYDIRGTSAHGHSVTMTEADFLLLAQGDSVVVSSTSGDGHIHEVTVSCT